MQSDYANFLSHSHGEGFMRFFEERCERPGIFIFDEPESALSPNRQFDFLRLLSRIRAQNRSQVIIATHSPILMAMPGAVLLRMRPHGLEKVALEDTEHFQITREFTRSPHEFVSMMLDA